MSDARNWGTHNTSFLEIAGAAIIPIGDRINTRVAAGAETFEIFRQGKYLVLEGEVGNARMRVGTLDRRTVTFSAANDTLTFGSAHPYETGDGPLRIDAQIRMTGTAIGTPTLQFDQIVAANDKLIRNAGSWVTDGFQVGDSITISGTGNGTNDGSKTIAAISTTSLANDTLEFAGDVLADQGPGVTARVIKGSEPTGAVWATDYWVIKVDATTIKLARTLGDALAGVAVDITAAPSGPWEIGGWQGSWTHVGFDPSGAVTTDSGESHKLLRAAEQVIVTAKSVTVRMQSPADVIKWWNVG